VPARQPRRSSKRIRRDFTDRVAQALSACRLRKRIALIGGPQFTFTPAISLFVSCESQAEVDELWARLLAGGGKPTACGWLEDRYGLSWQVIPTALIDLMSDPDPKASGRVAQALMGMQKIDLAALRRVHAAA
jgi:predicted 3-demethylubiquinone-9 3-methyltransferase (glyoxalase superfamily)